MRFIRDFFARRKLRGQKDSVRRMFFERAETFGAKTVKILERMPGVLEAVSELLNEKQSFKGEGQFEWGEVSLVAADTDDALMILVAILRFPPGSDIKLQTGEMVKVTPDTAQYFPPRVARVGIPLKMVDSTKEEVIAYLKKSEAEQHAETEEMKKTLKDVLGITTSSEEEEVEVPAKVIKKQDGLTTDADFDLTQLTEEQRQQLILSQKMGRG